MPASVPAVKEERNREAMSCPILCDEFCTEYKTWGYAAFAGIRAGGEREGEPWSYVLCAFIRYAACAEMPLYNLR